MIDWSELSSPALRSCREFCKNTRNDWSEFGIRRAVWSKIVPAKVSASWARPWSSPTARSVPSAVIVSWADPESAPRPPRLPAAVIARSFAGIFYRNAFNLGLPAVICPETGRVGARDRLVLDPEAGRLRNLTRGETYACEPVPAHLMALIRDGGLIPQLARRLKAETGKGAS